MARAYFQREWNDQIMNLNEIPPAAVPVMRAAYSLLRFVFLMLAMVSNGAVVTKLLGSSNSRFLYAALWEVSTCFDFFWTALFFTTSFSFFYKFYDILFIFANLESTASTVFDNTPIFPLKASMAYAWFVLYVTVYSQLMAWRIVHQREYNSVTHAVGFFTDFPYVCYHGARIRCVALYNMGRAMWRRGGAPDRRAAD
ncbi:hypothetical protein ABFX02_02G156700 [Erythranthe guttata]